MQVHTVETGDHSLKARGGKAAAESAVTAAVKAAVEFAQKLVSADSKCAQDVGGSSGKRRKDVSAKASTKTGLGKQASKPKRQKVT